MMQNNNLIADDSDEDDIPIQFGSFTLEEQKSRIHKVIIPASAFPSTSRSPSKKPAAEVKPPPASPAPAVKLPPTSLTPSIASPASPQPPAPPAKKFTSWASVVVVKNKLPQQPQQQQVQLNGANGPIINGSPSSSRTTAAGGDQQRISPGIPGDAAISSALATPFEQKEPGSMGHVFDLLSHFRLSEKIAKMMIDRRQRGLINTGNACFRNVILQALLACDPLFRILTELQPMVKPDAPVLSQLEEALPTWTSIARLAAAFEDPSLSASSSLIPYVKKDLTNPSATEGSSSAGGKKGKGKKKGGGQQQQASPQQPLSRRNQNIWVTSVRPDDFLGEAFGEFRSSEAGQQEDAQEFLHFMLEKLHEEVLAAAKAARGEGSPRQPQNGGAHGSSNKSNGNAVVVSPATVDVQTAVAAQRGEDETWQEIGKKGTRAVLNSTAQAAAEDEFDSSAITRIFYGRLRSDLRRGGSRSVSATMQRFECLQLDITGKETTTVMDALEGCFSEEIVSEEGSSHRQIKRMSIDVLPKVLVLHLVRFGFDSNRGGEFKVSKAISYPTTLDIPPTYLSSTLRAVVGENAKYQLSCVVLHWGRSLGGGHYTAYCKGQYPDEWYYYDDERVEGVGEAQVRRHAEQVYLLFYQRIEQEQV